MRYQILAGAAVLAAATFGQPAHASLIDGGEIVTTSTSVTIMMIYENAWDGHTMTATLGSSSMTITNPADQVAKFGSSTTYLTTLSGLDGGWNVIPFMLTDNSTGVTYHTGTSTPNGGDNTFHDWTANAASFDNFNSNGGEITYADVLSYYGGASCTAGNTVTIPSATPSTFSSICDPTAYSIVTDPNTIFLGWEDKNAAEGSDYDYNDIIFAITPVIMVPEPASLALFGAALLGLGALKRRRRKA